MLNNTIPQGLKTYKEGPGRFELGTFKNLYFRASGVLPIDSSRRELQNTIGEIEIGDFFDF